MDHVVPPTQPSYMVHPYHVPYNMIDLIVGVESVGVSTFDTILILNT